ncbi:MAG: transglycosylase domain-containing protein [Pyrinomonadaceae bacterium]
MLSQDGTFIANAGYMAAELTLQRTPGPKTAHPERISSRWVRTDLRRKAGVCCKVGAILLTAVCGTVAVLIHSSYSSFAQLIDQQMAGGYLRSHAGLYAAPRIIEKGAVLSKDQLATSLQRAGYARGKASNIWNGSFQMDENTIRIVPRQGSGAHQWIDVKFDDKGGRVASLSANDDSDLRSYAIEPELLTVDAALKTGQQETLTYQDIPSVLVQAILAIEDQRFFNHYGLDIRGIGRAFISWSTSGSVKFRQGGSTITQQLVKNTYLTPEKTLERKFNEAMIAVALEQRLSKQDIFALYCNEVYLGQRNGVGVRGVAQAARVFFGKELENISLAEAATIAGMIQSPARYAPDRHPDAARVRRDLVIAAMAHNGAIDEDSGQTVRALPVEVAAFEGSSNELAPYYVDAVNRAMDDAQRGLEPNAEQNLRVQTTIDPDLQTAAENALRHQLELLGKSSRGETRPQGAMVALDSHSGQVLAMVGGRSYEESQLNRATDARRQPGSVFKPFVYAAALEAGISPLSTFRDAPQTFPHGYATYSPANYGKAYSMRNVIMREGLIRSLNVVTVDLAIRTGLSAVAASAAKFGLPRPAAYPSLALGTTEVTPLQIAAAYAAFANGGKMVQPTVIARVIDNNGGEILVEEQPADRQAIKPTTAYLITDMLADVTGRGTARGAKGSFKNVAIAGKTGTSRDGWFVGYTPNLVCAVWIGFDNNQQLGLTGADAALPAWIDFMQEALAIRPSLGGTAFSKPRGITSVKIDPETGFLAGPTCPSTQTVNVPGQFAPTVECLEHREPELMYDAYTTDLEGFESSRVSADSGTRSSNQPEKLSDKELASDALGNFSGKPTTASHSTRNQTGIDVNQRGQIILVSAPRITDQGSASKVVRVRP